MPQYASVLLSTVFVAHRMGGTKAQLDDLVGIHPTSAEEFCTLDVTKRSGAAAEKQGC